MSNLMCARCFKTPKDIKGLDPEQKAYNYANAKGQPICSMECLRDGIDPVSEAARIGVMFMNDTLKFHFLLSCGREDDEMFQFIQDRRGLAASRLQDLQQTPEVKAVALP